MVPLGTVRLIREGFRRFGLHKLLDGFKESGVPLGLVIENLCISCLIEDYSMNDWVSFVNRSELRKQFYFEGVTIERWTVQRGLDRLGTYLEEVTEHLTKALRVVDPEGSTHAYVDGSHIERYGSKGSMVLYGEGNHTIQLQNQFMVASLIESGIPVAIELYPGNLNDPPQYADFIPQLLFLLKRGSLVVMDNGGSAAKTLDRILEHGDHYLTRVRINQSDLDIIDGERDRLVYVGMNTACITHTFASSGRTIYLFFSSDSYAASIVRAERAIAEKEIKRRKAQKDLEDGDAKKLISLPNNPFYEVVVGDAKLVMTIDPWIELDPEKELKDAMSPRGG